MQIRKSLGPMTFESKRLGSEAFAKELRDRDPVLSLATQPSHRDSRRLDEEKSSSVAQWDFVYPTKQGALLGFACTLVTIWCSPGSAAQCHGMNQP